jgi:hypothetical protein
MRRLTLGAAALVLGLGCAGPQLHFDYDAQASFGTYHAYDWYVAPKGAQAGGGSPIVDARVRRAVDTELAARGFRRETAADPDFLVVYYPIYEARRGHRPRVGIGLGLGGFRGVGLGVGVNAPVGPAPRGTIGSIVLEIQDFKTHQLVWKAEASDVLDDHDSPEDADIEVNRAVQKMLKRFPPTKG